MLLELGNVTTYRFPPQGQAKFLLKKLAEHADIAAFLRDQSEPVRAQIDSNDVHYNPASLTTNVYKVFTGIREQMMYSTNFYIGKQPSRPDQVEVFTSRSGVKVYRNPDAFPRAWTAHEAMAVESEDRMGVALESEAFDPRRS